MKLRILNETGHTEMTTALDELMDHVNEHPEHWIFIDGDFVTRSEISDVDWDNVTDVDLVPPIVGGTN